MPTILSRMRGASPLAESLKRFGDSAFGDTLTPAVKREQLYSLSRKNEGRDKAAAMIRQFGTGSYNANELAAHDYLAGGSASDLANRNLFQSADHYGAKHEKTTNAAVGAGENYSGTYGGFTDRMNAARDQHNSEPVKAMRGGSPVFVRRDELTGQDVSPVMKQTELSPQDKFDQYYELARRTGLSDEEAQRYALVQSGQRSAGMKVTTAPDGSVTVQQGGLGFEGKLTKSNTTKMQDAVIEGEKLRFQIDRAIELAHKDPSYFGVVGSARSKFQSLAGFAKGVGSLLGDEEYVKDLIAEMEQNRAAGNISYGFNPDLPELESLTALIKFQAAKVLAGQSGRSVSDADMKRLDKILPDAQSLFTTQATYIAKMQMIKRELEHGDKVARNALGQPSNRTDEVEGAKPEAAPAGDPLGGGAGNDPLGLRK